MCRGAAAGAFGFAHPLLGVVLKTRAPMGPLFKVPEITNRTLTGDAG